MKYDFYEQVYPNGETFYHLHLEEMSDAEYDKLKPIIESLGGHWRQKHKCFVFGEDIREKLKECLQNGIEISEKYLWQEKTQFFPTPITVAKRVAELAEFQDGNIVLEPSAGQGGLADFVPKNCPVLCIEPIKENIEVLTKKGYVTGTMTFEDYYTPSIQYDRIVMNPPFSGQRDIKHLMMAYDMLKVGGILVAVISENALYYQTELSQDFNKFLVKNNAMVEAVPPRAFKESGTTIETVIVKIIKT